MAAPVVTNILAGNAVVWYAPVGEAVPADSVTAGTTWGGNWARLGYTKAALSMLYEFDELDIMVEEELTAVDRRKTAENLTLETTLAEVTSAYLALLTSGTATTTAAGASQVGKDELTVGGESVIDKYAWGFEGTYTDSAGAAFPVRVFVWKGTAVVNGALEFSKADFPGVPLQIKALVDTSKSVGQKLFKLQRVTAVATS